MNALHDDAEAIAATVAAHYPSVQGVYLFGSQADGTARAGSDADIAVLLPHGEAKAAGHLAMSPCRFDLEERLGKPVDLVNLRQVSTVFQFQIIYGERILCADAYAMDEFEMLTMSFYQKLNEERAEILAEFERTGRAYSV